MSEVSDAAQLLIVTGKGAYLLGNITVKSAALVLKVLNTIYLAKWKGKVSLNRFRRICGGDFLFINIGSEEQKILRSVEVEMKAHGILFAKLPDLCGGDGRTQYVIPPSDMAKMKAFLLDHKEGKYGYIKAGPISPEDYARTGLTAAGKPTEELADLTLSALNALPEKKLTEKKKEKNELVSVEDVLKVPEVWAAVRKHDTGIEFGRHVSWIRGIPIKEHSGWGMYQMPDGNHAVLIPRQDMIPERKNAITGKVIPAEYAVFDAREYMVINLKDGHSHLQKGRDVIRSMNRADLTNSSDRNPEQVRRGKVKKKYEKFQKKADLKGANRQGR